LQGPRRGTTSECPPSETQTPGARNHDQTAALGHSQLMSSAKITRREIDWHTASVKDGTLTVEMTGVPSKKWGEHFGAVVALLGASHGAWRDTALRKTGIEVKSVREGAEEAVRHFLESVVLQVNVELRPEESPTEQAPSNAEENDQQAADRKMSEAFHAFAGSDGASAREDVGRQAG
jgi:hypothetical protein